MQIKKLSPFLVLVFIFIAACSGKSQLVLKTKPEISPSLKGEEKPKETSRPLEEEKKERTFLNQDESIENSQNKIIVSRKTTQESKKLKKKEQKPEILVHNQLLPTLTSTASVSTEALPLKESNSLSPGKKTQTQKEPLPPFPDEKEIIFNFDNADIHEVLNTIS
ncbi:MAG: hypothetical protein DRG25_03435, partial [Deltaproteobacteria bacterium]